MNNQRRLGAPGSQDGFSLVELMIVIVIIAIIAAVAVPAYKDQVRTAKRSDAIDQMQKSIAELEQWYNNNNVYIADPDPFGPGANGMAVPAPPAIQLYTISVNLTNGGQGFDIQADAVGDQANDTACTVMTINHRGVHTPPECFKR